MQTAVDCGGIAISFLPSGSNQRFDRQSERQAPLLSLELSLSRLLVGLLLEWGEHVHFNRFTQGGLYYLKIGISCSVRLREVLSALR